MVQNCYKDGNSSPCLKKKTLYVSHPETNSLSNNLALGDNDDHGII